MVLTKKEGEVYKYIKNVPEIGNKPVYIDKNGIKGVGSNTIGNTIKKLVDLEVLKPADKKDGVKNLYQLNPNKEPTIKVKEDTKTTPNEKSKSTNQSKDVEFYSPLHRSIQESILSNNLAPFLAFAKTQEAATDERKQLLKLIYDDIQKLITVSVPDFLQK